MAEARRNGFTFAAVTLLAALLLLYPLSSRALGAPQAEFSVKATKGYAISVEGSGRQVALTVRGHGGVATYSVRGRASSRQLKGRFGNLGRIATRFQARGKPKQVAPPKGCRGPEQTVTNGIFVGTIRFRGEDGYTQLRRNRVRGSMSSSPRWQCKSGNGSDRGAGSRGGLDNAPLGLPVLAASRSEDGPLFVAVGFNEREEIDAAIFVAGMAERLGSVRISRFATSFAKARAFLVAPGLAEATVRPPKPFSGTAVFARGADGSIEWSGSLTVSLPGAASVPLTGLGFTTDLVKPKTSTEFTALLGESGA